MPPNKYAQNAPSAPPAVDSACRGPLCGKPEIDAALETESKKGFGFVFESNGYMCLLVGTDVTGTARPLACR
jgi:hypothetical protein